MGDIVRKQKNGKFLGWYVRYIDSDGRRKQRASHQPTKALARRFLVEIEARVARGQCGLPEAAPPPRELSVAELCELYVTGYSRPRIKNLAQYRTEQRSALRRILPQLGARLCSAVAASDIRRLRDSLAESYKPNTVMSTLRPLSTAYSWGRREGLISCPNPCLGVERPPRESLLEFLNRDDLRRLLATAEEHAASATQQSSAVAETTSTIEELAATAAIGLGTELVGTEQTWAGCGACDPARINPLDRGVPGNHNPAAKTYSDIGLYTAIGLPFALDLGDSLIQRARDGSAQRSRHMRNWGRDVVILLETFAVNYATTNVVKFAVRRPRPYSYDPDSDVADPTANDARLSFFSGHASTTFAMAAAYASLFQARHPRSRWIAPVWVIGMSLASTTAIARVAAGKHFWTDIIVGAAVGSAVGVAIPALHRRREQGPARHMSMSLAPARTGSLLLVQGRF